MRPNQVSQPGLKNCLSLPKAPLALIKGKANSVRNHCAKISFGKASIPLLFDRDPTEKSKLRSPRSKSIHTPGSNPSKWDGLVDSREASTTPQKTKVFSSTPRTKILSETVTPAKEAGDDDYDYDSDDIDGYPPGMLPPVLMSSARRR